MVKTGQRSYLRVFPFQPRRTSDSFLDCALREKHSALEHCPVTAFTEGRRVQLEEIVGTCTDTVWSTSVSNTPSKETFPLLAIAASRIQLSRRARTASGWYFTLAAFVLLAALFHWSTPIGIGWLAVKVTRDRPQARLNM
jgi:hypothetical protein